MTLKEALERSAGLRIRRSGEPYVNNKEGYFSRRDILADDWEIEEKVDLDKISKQLDELAHSVKALKEPSRSMGGGK